MTLLFADGFDHYTEASDRHLAKWDFESATTSTSVNSGTGQAGSDSFRTTSSVQWGKSLPTPTTDAEKTLITGFWVTNTTGTSASAGMICNYYNNSSSLCGIYYNDGRLQFQDTNSREYMIPGVNLKSTRQYYIEFKTVFDSVTGTVTVKIDGEIRANIPKVDTGNSLPDEVRLGTATFMSTWDFDDFYILNTAGSAPFNDFLGPIRIETLFPDADGTQNDWTALVGAGGNFEDVDDNPPDDDTTYVSTSTASDVELYSMDNLSATSGTIAGVQVNAYARKEGISARTITFAALENITQEDDQDETGLGNTYKFKQGLFTTNPDTTSAWTISEVNAAEFGFKLKS